MVSQLTIDISKLQVTGTVVKKFVHTLTITVSLPQSSAGTGQGQWFQFAEPAIYLTT
jgi:hypothetical protein